MNNQFINTRNIFIMATIAIISFALGFFVNNYTSEGNLIADDNKEIVITEPTKIVSELKDERVKASPLAKKLANEKGIDISNISGSGDGGRIIRKDIENYKNVSTSSDEPFKEITLPKIHSEESFEELPENAKKYIVLLSNILETPIKIISTGPKRNQIISI